jgi:hypothetical protein
MGPIDEVGEQSVALKVIKTLDCSFHFTSPTPYPGILGRFLLNIKETYKIFLGILTPHSLFLFYLSILLFLWRGVFPIILIHPNVNIITRSE